jgi:hypothetical protein
VSHRWSFLDTSPSLCPVLIGEESAFATFYHHRNHDHCFLNSWSSDRSSLSPGGVSIAILAGIINGVGLIAYYAIVSGAIEHRWPASNLLTISLILTVTGIMFVGCAFWGETLTLKKLFGVTFALFAIWLLRQ